MSITQFKDTLNRHLPDSNPVAVPLGTPVAVASTLSVERNDGVETGIWECTLALAAPDRGPGVLPLYPGPLHLHPDDGETPYIEAGDALMLLANSTGIWDIQETVTHDLCVDPSNLLILDRLP